MKKLTLFFVMICLSLGFSQNSAWMKFDTTNSPLPSNQINSIAVDSLGIKWIAAEKGFLKLKDSTWTLFNSTNSPLYCPHPLCVTIDKTGIKWIATYCQGIVRYNDTTFTYWDPTNSPLPYATINSVAICKGNNRWLGLAQGGIAKFSTKGDWTFWNTSNSPLPSDHVKSVAVDLLNTKWFGTDKGVASFDNVNWNIYNISNGLPSNDVLSIAADAIGNVWVGTSAGLAKFNGTSWTVYDTSNCALTCNKIVSLSKGQHGDIWIGTETGGYNHFDGINWSSYNSTNSLLPENWITATVVEKNDNKFIGTHGHGLYIYNPNGVALPVELTLFTLSTNKQDVILQWSTVTELNSSLFRIERKSSDNQWEKIAEVKAAGSSLESKNYSYTDRNLSWGQYTYRLKILDNNGSFKYSNEIFADINSPEGFVLNQNYPNPFNPSTNISYYLPTESKISLTIFNSLGEQVSRLISDEESKGLHEINFNAANLAAGMYIYKLKAISSDGKSSYTSSGKMLFIK